jgi:hypothetical protein
MKKSITRKELIRQTQAPVYVIKYLLDCNRLKIVRDSAGPGHPILFHPDSIKIVKNHLTKNATNGGG